MKRKGFTLIELIIVMALFSLVMYGVIQLLDPISKYFVRSQNYESTTACVDNMTRAIEGNLKYADRIRAYTGYKPYDTINKQPVSSTNPTGGTMDPSDKLETDVKKFYNDFFANRRFLDCAGTIHVLIFDNTVDTSIINTYSRLADYTGGRYNAGNIIHATYQFDNYGVDVDGQLTGAGNDADSVFATGDYNVWYVNQKLYGNFDYHFTLGSDADLAVAVTTSATAAPVTVTTLDTTTDPSVTTLATTTVQRAAVINFNPQDFAIRIDMTELVKSKSAAALERKACAQNSICSFTMKNVLNSFDRYSTVLQDRVLVSLDTSIDELTAPTPGYQVDRILNRYDPLDRYTQANPGDPDPFDGFYFIYTLPEDTYSLDEYPNYNSTYKANFDSYIITGTTT